MKDTLLSILGDNLFFHKIYEREKNKKVVLPEGFTLTAHTGCEGTADNSLEAIQKGFDCGANTVEFDVNFTPDGVPVLAHDTAADSTVSLAEAFELIAGLPGLTVNVDCKTTENLKAISDLAEQYGVKDRIFYTGIEEKDVDAVKMSAPAVDYYLNMSVEKPSEHTEEYLQTLVDKVKECGAIGINFNKKSASKELVDYFHANGLLVSIFTVDDKVEMYDILSYAPDNITTRCPDDLQEILKEF